MTKYQLAKLIVMAGKLESRKRVQKTVHLLQAAGCRFDTDFRVHFYGPYSSEVAGLLDQMTEEGILVETSRSFTQGTQYDYSLDDSFRQGLERHEQTPSGQKAKAEIEEYGDLFKDLCEQHPKTLELASTIVAFRQQGCDWDEATREACEFKKVHAKSPRRTRARELAEKVTTLAAPNNGNNPSSNELIGNMWYGAAMCRIHYLRVPDALPEAGDIPGMAAYWKEFYNTFEGSGTEEEFEENWFANIGE